MGVRIGRDHPVRPDELNDVLLSFLYPTQGRRRYSQDRGKLLYPFERNPSLAIQHIVHSLHGQAHLLSHLFLRPSVLLYGLPDSVSDGLGKCHVGFVSSGFSCSFSILDLRFGPSPVRLA